MKTEEREPKLYNIWLVHKGMMPGDLVQVKFASQIIGQYILAQDPASSATKYKLIETVFEEK